LKIYKLHQSFHNLINIFDTFNHDLAKYTSWFAKLIELNVYSMDSQHRFVFTGNKFAYEPRITYITWQSPQLLKCI